MVNPSKGIGPWVLDFLHPPGGQDQENSTPMRRVALRVWTVGARVADRALA